MAEKRKTIKIFCYPQASLPQVYGGPLILVALHLINEICYANGIKVKIEQSGAGQEGGIGNNDGLDGPIT